MSPLVYARADGRLIRAGDGSDRGPWGSGTARFDPYGSARPVGGETVGVIPGVNRATWTGDLVLDSSRSGTVANPTVISNLDIVDGRLLRTTGHNIKLQNVKVRGSNPPLSGAQTGNWPCIQFWGDTALDVVLEDIEIDPMYPSVYTYGIHGYGFTLRRFWIHDCTDGIVTYGTAGSLQEGGLVNRVIWWSYDPNQTDGAHCDPWQAEGGTNHKAFGVEYDISPGPANRTNGNPGAGYSVLGTQNNAVSTNFELGYCWFVGNTTFSNIQWGDSGKGGWVNPSIHDSRFLGTFGSGGHSYMRISDLTRANLTFDRNTGPTGQALTKTTNVVETTTLR